MKLSFRYSIYLFGSILMASLSVAAVSGVNSLTNRPIHKATKPRDQGEFQLSASFNAVQQTQSISSTITIWYGSSQDFGLLGNPQPMINILGNVSDPDGIASLEYSLNGGAWHDLSWKETASINGLSASISEGMTDDVQAPLGSTVDGLPTVQGVNAPSTNPRLVSEGDFNIEIDTIDLNNGPNTITIQASDNALTQTTTTEPVTVTYTSGQTWPMPYTANWSDGLANVAQVVDGEWAVVGGRLRPTVTGYDRLVAVGDLLAWDDFEVRVPVTIHALPVQNSGGVGIVTRWQGHFVQNNEQPGTGWWHMGAYAYYRNRDCAPCPHFALRTSNAAPLQVPATLNIGVPYNFLLRTQTKACGGHGLYSFKVWHVGSPEPASWIFEECDDPSNAYSNGSVLLVAHNIDASFGDVTILPVLDVNMTISGDGTIDVDPPLNGTSEAYIYGDPITITATADPGWTFSGWSGDLSGNTNPVTLNLSEDLNATANFIQANSLDLNIAGNGSVVADPAGPEYTAGTTVTLTATADPDWYFVDWSGDLSSSANPTSLLVNSSKVVTATFKQGYTLDISLSGGGTVAVEPKKPVYAPGEVVTLTAEPDLDWIFHGWGGDLSVTQNPISIAVSSHMFVTAYFGGNRTFIPLIFASDA